MAVEPTHLSTRSRRSKSYDQDARIGYLLGYNSSNIFRIWTLEEKKIIATRDATFDESKKHHLDNLTFELSKRVEEPLQPIGFLEHSELARGVESDEEEFETQSIADSVDSDQ